MAAGKLAGRAAKTAPMLSRPPDEAAITTSASLVTGSAQRPSAAPSFLRSFGIAHVRSAPITSSIVSARSVRWKLAHEVRAVTTAGTLGANRPAVQLDQLASDREPKPQPSMLALNSHVALTEAVENERKEANA